MGVLNHGGIGLEPVDGGWVTARFARQLERELDAAKWQLRQWTEIYEHGASGTPRDGVTGRRDGQTFLCNQHKPTPCTEQCEGCKVWEKGLRSWTVGARAYAKDDNSAQVSQTAGAVTDAERLSWLNLHWERIEYGGDDISKLRELIDAAMG